jgi:HD-like signal output (HDOD) protein
MPGTPPSDERKAALAVVLTPSRLPTPPAVALKVAQAAARPDCRPAQIAALLGHDPALCGRLLKAANSCIYGPPRPVTSADRAVVVLGLKTVRSLVLGLSLPAMRSKGDADGTTRDYWVQSVAGAIIARELAVVARHPCPEDALTAGLLRDMGQLLLRQAYPGSWAEVAERNPERVLTDPCGLEREAFGVDHADVTAELLRGWNLPPEIVEPIRYHHEPDRLEGAPRAVADRVAVLSLASSLAVLDAVADHPEELSRVLDLASERFGLSGDVLVQFLRGVSPKVEAFAQLIDQDIGTCPDFGTVLATATDELARLRAESSTPARGSAPLRASNRWPTL